MNNTLKLTSPMPPSVNHYTGIRTINKNGRMMTMVYETAEAKAYKTKFKEIILNAVKEQNWSEEVNKTQHFYVDCVFYFDRIDKDSSNYDKCLLDTITETQKIWEDDNVALVRVQAVYYDTANPRIEIEIKPVDYIGIFDNKQCLENFDNHCKNCTRYLTGRCSILNKAIEGKIQTEINTSTHNNVTEYTCQAYKPNKTIKNKKN